MMPPNSDVGALSGGEALTRPVPGDNPFLTPSRPMPESNLSLDLVRATEAAALAAARWVGRGDKDAADQAAVDAMRLLFNAVHMDGIVVIGEGEKDMAPMLFNGER